MDAAIHAHQSIACTPEQANYLFNVLRLGTGGRILIFNGSDGEWFAEIVQAGRKSCAVTPLEQSRAQTKPQDLHYIFAPLKHARLDYMVQKAVECGASSLRPVLTARTVSTRINQDRMRANAIEAAEQCGILSLPVIEHARKLADCLSGWHKERALIFCDEAAGLASPIQALEKLPRGPLAVLIGPEGGFTGQERELLLSCSFVYPIALGPRIMRADTAAVAALSLVNAVLGDWR
jgi:16S rRNA (uracil1498-N3)-methyltransferase